MPDIPSPHGRIILSADDTWQRRANGFPTERDYEVKGDRRDFGIEMLKQLVAPARCRRHVDKGAL
jgi:hypothetical protein